MQRGLVGSEMCIRDRYQRRVHGEKFINKTIAKELLSEMNNSSANNTKVADELMSLRNIVKEQIDVFDELVEKYNIIADDLRSRSDELTDNAPILRIKRAISDLREELISMELTTSFLQHHSLRHALLHSIPPS
eukprot:TRINITY_DN11147_c0_g1_i2.p2 TRINITY_DN11147_c0_g1~~TRINITY_DN11147_c0_g1_i2.p2  ORF type:complete len:134 (-),score=31.48 TRINITY_DN11147_c0_g1_i2:201-602(-)